MKAILASISILVLTTAAASAAQMHPGHVSSIDTARATRAPADQMYSTTGTIESFDPRSKTVQLTTGTKYQLPRNADFRGLAIGEKVRITWKAQDPYGTSFGNGESDEFNATRMVVVH